MNPIKWSPFPADYQRQQVGQVQPKQLVNMRGGVVKPNSQPLYNALQQRANNQFTAMRDQQQFNRQIARDNIANMRKRANIDYEYKRRKELAEEAEKKIKEQEEFEWNERGGKLKHQLTELKFKQTLLTELGNIDKKEHANIIKQNLQTTLEEKKQRLDEVKGETAQRWLEENIDDEFDAGSFSEQFGEKDFDWEHVADDGDITVGGNTFTEDMGNDELRQKYESLSGAEKIEFARQLAKRKEISFDEAIMVSQEQKDLEEQIQQMEEVSMTIMETNPDDIRMMRQQLLSILNPNLETELRNELMNPGNAPSFNPEESGQIEPGMGRDAAQQRSLDFGNANESAGSIEDLDAIADEVDESSIRTEEAKKPDWSTSYNNYSGSF
jgi:hypothetical protein